LLLIGFAFGVGAPTLLTLLLVITRMSGPTGQIQQGCQQLANVLPLHEKVKEMEAELATLAPDIPALTAHLPALDGSVSFENVSFVHPAADDETGSARGVHELSLAIAAGEVVGIAGASGAGKTTFVDLLVGLFPPQQGLHCRLRHGPGRGCPRRLACGRAADHRGHRASAGKPGLLRASYQAQGRASFACRRLSRARSNQRRIAAF
jgi:ABC-type transport system involved in cytochrome bd biosynthesis fused ATPase/permease subunit